MHDLSLIETALVMQEWIWHLVFQNIMSSNTHSPFKTENFGYEHYIMYNIDLSLHDLKKISGVK